MSGCFSNCQIGIFQKYEPMEHFRPHEDIDQYKIIFQTHLCLIIYQIKIYEFQIKRGIILISVIISLLVSTS